MLTYRKIPVLVILSFLILALSGCCLSHQWQEATCVSPKTCVQCGKTEGETQPHSWQDATCAVPRTCKDCGLTEGETLPHIWKEATCEAPETCRACGATQGQALGHIEGETKVGSVDCKIAMVTLEYYCQQCGNVMSTREEKMKTLHEDGRFLMSPQDFVHRLNDAFAKIPNSNIRAERTTNNGALVITLSSGNTNVGNFVLFDTYLENTEDYCISPERATMPLCFDFALGSMETDPVTALYVIVASMMACDPAMDLEEHNGELEEVVSDILARNPYECNGITYAFLDGIGEDYWIFAIGFDDLL